MPIRNYVFVDSKFNEYIYDLAVNLTAGQRGRISPFLAAKIRTNSAAKKWANGQKLEEKLAFLASIGMEGGVFVYNPETFNPDVVKRVYKQNAMDGTPAENIKQMIQQKFFVIHTKDIAESFVLMSNNCHGDSYYINQNFLKVRKAVGVTKHLELSELNIARQTRESLEGVRELCRIMLNAWAVNSFVGGKFTMQPVHLAVLTLLAMHPQNYVSITFIRRNLSHTYKESVINRAAGELMHSHKYIDRLPKKEDRKSYRITTAGLIAIGQVLNHIVNSEIN